MTILLGGRPKSIQTAAPAIAAAVTLIVIAGQLRKTSLAAMQPCFWFCEQFDYQSRSPTSGVL
jgi:hypothetical protein